MGLKSSLEENKMFWIILFIISLYGSPMSGGTPDNSPDTGIEPGTRISVFK